MEMEIRIDAKSYNIAPKSVKNSTKKFTKNIARKRASGTRFPANSSQAIDSDAIIVREWPLNGANP